MGISRQVTVQQFIIPVANDDVLGNHVYSGGRPVHRGFPFAILKNFAVNKPIPPTSAYPRRDA